MTGRTGQEDERDGRDERDPVLVDLDELTSRLATAVSRIARRIRVTTAGISYGLLSTLATVERIGPLRLGELALAERVTRPAVTRMVTELGSKGYIARVDDPSDGRACVVSITEAGREALAEARRERAADVAELVSGLSPAEIDSIASCLPALEKISLKS